MKENTIGDYIWILIMIGVIFIILAPEESLISKPETPQKIEVKIDTIYIKN